MTLATELETQLFTIEFSTSYPVIAQGEAIFEAYSEKGTWGSVVYLVDADGMIRARGIDDARAIMGGTATEDG